MFSSSDLNRRVNIPGAGGMSRREAIRLGLVAAAGGLLLPYIGRSDTVVAPTADVRPPPSPRAKAVIQVWLWGGPAHLDTFDPKPEAGPDYCGPFTKPIETNVPGMRICEMLPLLAKQADKYSLIRSLTHGVNAHETAAYIVQTGHPAGARDVYPGIGAVVSLFKGYGAGYRGLIPPYIVMSQPQGRFSESGFLGPRYKPFATGGDPAAARFLVEGIVSPSLTEERLKERRRLLAETDTFGRALRAHDPAALKTFDRAGDEAYEMILGDAGKVFDLAQEPDAVRDRYGRNTLGQACLAARRLVERGVPYVTINANGWDTHKQHFQTMRRKLPELDQGVSGLLEDLSQRGLLDSTVVWVCGEFSRTPKVQNEAPWNGGRNHYGKVQSALVAGGGLRGGQVVGSTDAKGENAVERPLHPADLLETIYGQLGIAADAKLPHPEGLDVRVLPGKTELPQRTGAIRELI
ncbi:MAG: DUF1501 domain-containing protein [Opitutaceae bacterium]